MHTQPLCMPGIKRPHQGHLRMREDSACDKAYHELAIYHQTTTKGSFYTSSLSIINTHKGMMQNIWLLYKYTMYRSAIA